MARARIGKLFHLTPLVDSLADAEFFFNTVFSPLCMMRNYSSHWHRHAAIYIIGETSIEPMHCLPPGPATKRRVGSATPSASARACTTSRSTSTTSTTSRERLEAAGVRITDGGSGHTVFCHPKDTPGMLEFHPATGGHVGGLDPRFRPEWAAFRDAYWPTAPARAVQRMSHITVVVDDLDAAEKFYVDVLDAVPLPDQAATVAGGTSPPRAGGRGHRDRAARRRATTDSVAARDLDRVGPSVTGVTFTVQRRAPAPPSGSSSLSAPRSPRSPTHEVRLDVDHDVGLRVPLHRPGAHGRPASVTTAAMVGGSSSTQSRARSAAARARRRRR